MRRASATTPAIKVKPTEDYASEHSNQDKLQAHAKLMLLMAAREVKPHIDSPSATSTILTKPSAYFHGEIATITSRTNQCRSSEDFYKFIGVNKPEKFHVELTDKVCASLRQAWSSYSAKRVNRNGTDFYNFVNKRISLYAPKIEANGKRFEIAEEPIREPVGRARLLPPVRPPVVKATVDEPPGLTDFVETKKDVSKPMPALVPLQKAKPETVEKPMPALVPLQKEKPATVEKPMPALVPLKKEKSVAIEKPMPALVPLKAEKPMPALVPIEKEKSAKVEKSMPALVPIGASKTAIPELVPIDTQENIEDTPRGWFRKKRAERKEAAMDKTALEAKKKKAEAEAAEMKAQRAKEKAEAARSKVKEELPVKPISVQWLSRVAKGKDGAEPIALEAGKTYTFLAPSDSVVDALTERQRQRGTTFNKRMFLQNHLAEVDLRGKVDATFKTGGGVTISKRGSQITEPALANPTIVSSSLHEINGAKVIVLVHDNVLPVKTSQ